MSENEQRAAEFAETAQEVRRAKKLGKHDYGDVFPDPWLPEPDEIPQWIRETPPWMCWAFEWHDGGGELAKVPRSVHRGDYRVSVTDPDNWSDFETALKTAQQNGWGVGPVFHESNALVGTDIDDGRDPATSQPTDVAKDIIQTLDTWTEVSVSGTGYHAIARGELPDGGNRSGDVEMYGDSRFFAITGQHVSGTPEDVEQRQDAIEAVHQEYIADDEDEGAPELGSDGPTEPTAESVSDIPDDELIERAKNAKNGAKFSALWRGDTSGYPSHSEAQQALANLLAFWTGGDESRMRRLFRTSNMCRGEDDIRTFENYETRTALDGWTEFYEPGRRSNPRPAADGGAAAVSEPGSNSDADTDGDDERAKPEHFEVRNGGYGQTLEKQKDGETYFVWDEWTNFEIELESLIRTPSGDTEMSLTITPRNEDAYTVDVEPTVLNETRSFKKEVCTGATTTFDGNDSNLTKIKQFVGGQEAPRKVGTRHMGYHACRDDEDENAVWVTPNGTLGPDGWIEDSERVLIEQDVTAERKWNLDPEQHTDYDPQNVAEMIELLTASRDPERLLPLLGYFYAASVKPLVMEWNDQFNYVGVSGGSGSGKTTTIETLWQLFGMEGDPLSADSTKITLLQTLSASNAIPMWFDEYKPSDMSDYKVKQFKNELRKTTRGGISTRGNADLSDTEYRLHAPVVISGEERIQGTAEERRGIFTSFRKSTTEPGTPTAHANAKLLGSSDDDLDENDKATYYEGYDFDEHALAWVQWITAQDPERLKTYWQAANEYTKRRLSELGETGLRNLPQQGVQTIRFGCQLARLFYEDMTEDDGTAVITDEEIDGAVEFVVTGSAGGGNSQRDHLDVLLDVASRAARVGALREGDGGCYTFVRKGSDKEELRINLSTAFDKIKKYAREHEVSEDLLNNKSDYDSRLRDDADNIEWLTCRSQYTPSVGHALGVDTEIAGQEIDGFGRWMWDEDVEGAQPDSWQRLDTGASGRINITFEVTESTTDTPNSMAERGVIADKSKSMDYVVWADDRDTIPRFEEGECYAVKGAKQSEYEGSPQIVFDSGAHDIMEVEKGFGHIEVADAGNNTRLSAAEADGGEVEQLSAHVMDIVESQGPVRAEFIAGMIVGSDTEIDYSPTDVSEAIDALESKGRITDFGDGYEVPWVT